MLHLPLGPGRSASRADTFPTVSNPDDSQSNHSYDNLREPLHMDNPKMSVAIPTIISTA